MGKSLTRATVLVVTMLLAFPVFAAKGGNNGKPGGGGDDGGANCDTDALFPALIYPEDSADGNGTRDLVVASSDGCVQITVELGIQLGGARLKYDETTRSGYYAWSENVFPGNPPGTIWRRNFTVPQGSQTLELASPYDLYKGVGYLSSFELQGDLLAVVDQQSESGEQTLLVIDLSTCDGGLLCDGSDAVSVYAPSAIGVSCLQDIGAIVDCFRPESGLTMALDGTVIYFDVQGQDSNGGRVYGIARVTRGTKGWRSQTPDLFLRDDNYYEARVYGLSQNSQYLAFGYLAGFQNRLRDDRVIILDTEKTVPNSPYEADGLSQNFSAWTATWTIKDTFYVLGTAGKGRKLRHPIEEFDPGKGTRRPLGISLNDHPGIDSSL